MKRDQIDYCWPKIYAVYGYLARLSSVHVVGEDCAVMKYRNNVLNIVSNLREYLEHNVNNALLCLRAQLLLIQSVKDSRRLLLAYDGDRRAA